MRELFHSKEELINSINSIISNDQSFYQRLLLSQIRNMQLDNYKLSESQVIDFILSDWYDRYLPPLNKEIETFDQLLYEMSNMSPIWLLQASSFLLSNPSTLPTIMSSKDFEMSIEDAELYLENLRLSIEDEMVPLLSIDIEKPKHCCFIL